MTSVTFSLELKHRSGATACRGDVSLGFNLLRF